MFPSIVHILYVHRNRLCTQGLLSFLFIALSVLAQGITKVRPTTLVVSLEGEAKVYNIKDDFEVNLSQNSIGKKIDSKSIISTEKNGTLGLLFSNGTLITIKPGSRFFIREYSQKIISAENLPDPSQLEEEPSQSKLLAHLDFGELVVKVPKLKKGSTMNLTSPLGTAGIRGTMFQMMAVRNDVTGDIMGGVNLISGDISYTNTNGVKTNLFSGQSIQLATSRLGETQASLTGGLVNLSQKFGASLAEDILPPPIEVLFPTLANEADSEQLSLEMASPLSTGFAQTESFGFENIHDLASEIFFQIEESENNSESISFASLNTAVGTETPTEILGGVPVSSVVVGVTGNGAGDFFMGLPPTLSLIGDEVYKVEMLGQPFSDFDPWINAKNFLDQDISGKATLLNPPDIRFPGTYELNYRVEDIRGFVSTISRTVNVVITPPVITLFGGRQGVIQQDAEVVIPYLVQRRIPTYPVADDGPFQLLANDDPVYPGYDARDFAGRDLRVYVEVLNDKSVDYTQLGQITELSLSVTDLPTRKIKTPEGKIVSTSVKPKIKIIDNLPPLLSHDLGLAENNPMQVEGVLGTFFVDPGISILDNYYTQQEIEQHLGLQSGSADSAFGFVDMEVAGIYRLDYQGIIDPSGNEAETLSRWVEVFDVTPPVMTLYGADPYYVDVNSTNVFVDPGAFALDNLDRLIEWENGNGRVKLSIEKLMEDDVTYQKVDTTIPAIMAEAKKQISLHATFRLTYSVQDVVGNESSIQRQLVLINSPFPEPRLVMHGDRTFYHEVNTEFSDPGVTAYKDLGSGLKPISLNEYMTVNAFLVNDLGIKEPTVIDPTFVNFYGAPHHASSKGEYYIDKNGSRFAKGDSGWRRLIIEYFVVDQFGNTNQIEREVRIQDTTKPVIVLNEGPQGVNFPDLQGGKPYVEPGATITDNYDSTVSLTSTLLRKVGDQYEEFEIADLDTDGFSLLGDYIMRYKAIDANDNEVILERKITVIDTIAPQVALVTHDYFTGTPFSTFNTSEFGDKPIVDTKYPIPDPEVIDFLTPISSQFADEKFNDSIFAITLGDNQNFYISLESDPNGIEAFLGQPTTTYVKDPSTQRSRAHYSAFSITDGTRKLQDPGVYARNDTELDFEFSHTFDIEYIDELLPTGSIDPKVGRVIINYVIKQSSGEVVYIPNARSIYFLDIKAPNFLFEPLTPEDSNQFISIEAGIPFHDDDSQDVKLYDIASGGFGSLQKNTIRVIDARDYVVTEDISRKIFEGSLESELGGNPNGNYNFVIPLAGHPADSTKMEEAIDTTRQNNLNRTFLIEYTAEDKRDEKYPKLESNKATLKRRFIVKDTTAPKLTVMNNVYSAKSYRIYHKTIELDYLLGSPTNKNKPLADGTSMNVIVDSEVSVKEYLARIFTVDDFDKNFGYAETRDTKWSIDISPAYQGAVKYPADLDTYKAKSDSGYTVTINVTDESGNKSDDVVFKLVVIDATPPEIYLLGDAEIHDFFRFAPNTSLTNQEVPWADRPVEDPSNKVYDADGNLKTPYNSSGFTGGGHRMLRSKYNFIDPGVYAEDYNGDFDVRTGLFPDLDGDGIGETHGYEKLPLNQYDLIKWDLNYFSNSQTFKTGVIYVHTSFVSVENEQMNLTAGITQNEDYAQTTSSEQTNASIPTGPNLDFNSSFANVTQLNVQKTTFNFTYVVKDSWDNVVKEPKVRRVHIYESEQFPGYAFYATPIVNGVELASYYDTNGTSDNFLSSIRKDHDGDGVSDFWEVVLSEQNQNAHLDPSLVDSTWHDPQKLNSALASLTREKLTVGGEDVWINSFGELRDRVNVLVDGTNNSDIGRQGMFSNGQGLNRVKDSDINFPDNNILNLDFNKAIP